MKWSSKKIIKIEKIGWAKIAPMSDRVKDKHQIYSDKKAILVPPKFGSKFFDMLEGGEKNSGGLKVVGGVGYSGGSNPTGNYEYIVILRTKVL